MPPASYINKQKNNNKMYYLITVKCMNEQRGIIALNCAYITQRNKRMYSMRKL